MKNLLLAAVCLLFSTGLYAQDTERFSVFVMGGVSTFEECKEIEKEFRSIQGVSMARADVHTKRFYVIYTDDSGLDQKEIDKRMEKLGVELKCYHEGIQSVDPFVPVSEETCDE